jgi:hypothetical protein
MEMDLEAYLFEEDGVPQLDSGFPDSIHLAGGSHGKRSVEEKREGERR